MSRSCASTSSAAVRASRASPSRQALQASRNSGSARYGGSARRLRCRQNARQSASLPDSTARQQRSRVGWSASATMRPAATRQESRPCRAKLVSAVRKRRSTAARHGSIPPSAATRATNCSSASSSARRVRLVAAAAIRPSSVRCRPRQREPVQGGRLVRRPAVRRAAVRRAAEVSTVATRVHGQRPERKEQP
jgi:hypothetical protein